MKIGNIDFGDHPVFLAPMEDVTDIGFRLLCKRFGAAMVYTEFVSAEALIRDVKSTISKLTISDTERPVGIQIYGRDIEAMVEAAKIVEQAGPDLIDLNFGCPVKKVAGKGAGAGMLQNIPKMLEITQKVVDAVKLPVTVKTRLGWNQEQLIITSLAGTIVTPAGSVLLPQLRSAPLMASSRPTSVISTPYCSRAASAPLTGASGAKSPPMASTMIFMACTPCSRSARHRAARR